MKKILDDIKSARWAIIVIIAYFVFFSKLLYTICPVVLLTGYPCPGCGMTRAALRLLRFDFTGAWQMHPFIYAVAVLAIFFCINRYFLKEKYTSVFNRMILLTGIAMVVFYLWRMYTMFPDVTPMIYYEGNCLKRLLYLLTYYGIA